MTGFTALVASLASRVQRSTVGRRAVSGDVTKLSTGVALHCLRLAVTGEVVRPAAFVAGSGSGTTGETASAAKTGISAATDGATPSHRNASRVGASSS